MWPFYSTWAAPAESPAGCCPRSRRPLCSLLQRGRLVSSLWLLKTTGVHAFEKGGCVFACCHILGRWFSHMWAEAFHWPGARRRVQCDWLRATFGSSCTNTEREIFFLLFILQKKTIKKMREGDGGTAERETCKRLFCWRSQFPLVFILREGRDTSGWRRRVKL